MTIIKVKKEVERGGTTQGKKDWNNSVSGRKLGGRNKKVTWEGRVKKKKVGTRRGGKKRTSGWRRKGITI